MAEEKVNSNEKEVWIIASCDSDSEGCGAMKFIGTEDEVKEYMADMIHEALHADDCSVDSDDEDDESYGEEDNGWYGTEDPMKAIRRRLYGMTTAMDSTAVFSACEASISDSI